MATAFFSDDWLQTLKAASRITSLPKSWLSTDACPHKNWPGELSNEGLPDPDDDQPDLAYDLLSMALPPADDISFELPLPRQLAPKLSPCSLFPSLTPDTPKNSWTSRVQSKHPGLSPLFVPDADTHHSSSPSPFAVPKCPVTSRLKSYTSPLSTFSGSLPDLVPACPASPCTPCSTSDRSRSPYTPSLLRPKLEDQVVADIRKRQWGPKRSRKRQAEETPAEVPVPSESAAASLDAPDVPTVPRFAEILSELRSFIASGPPPKKSASKRSHQAPIATANTLPTPPSYSARSADCDQSQSFSRSASPTSTLSSSKSDLSGAQNVTPPCRLLFDEDPSSRFMDCLLMSSSQGEAARSNSCVSSIGIHPAALDVMNRLLAIPGVSPLTPPQQTAAAPKGAWEESVRNVAEQHLSSPQTATECGDDLHFGQVDKWEEVLALLSYNNTDPLCPPLLDNPKSLPSSGEVDHMAKCGDETADWLTSLLSNHDVDSENRLYTHWY